MNIVRLGHLYTPPGHGVNVGPGGRCETALVCGVEPPTGAVTLATSSRATSVNLRVFDHEAVDRRELHIPVGAPSPETGISFHLSGDCPWQI